MKNKFYITTTLPYVNAKPHIGFAKEIVEADVLARFHREQGSEVFFNTGTDEHGQKIYQKAVELGKDAQAYCDSMVPDFDKLKQSLNLSYDNFIRTTNPEHIKAVQTFWQICEKNGDIYKKNYKVKYCVGCELEKTDSELLDGKCPDHPNMEIETIEEENYFFRFSAYQEKLLELYKNNPNFVVPQKRMNEVRSFVERGLEDFSISRLKNKMAWGVPVPGDDEHVMYVWFDALVNYISTLGWPISLDNFEKFWPGVQVCGKDNLRQQSAMWQAMLMSANLPNSKQIFVNGFITVDGQKMSKSLGNVISPYEMVEKFGTDATRYLLLAGASFGEDFDITWEKLIEKYNADLANGLGNLISRVIKLSEKCESCGNSAINPLGSLIPVENFEKMELDLALNSIWNEVRNLNKRIDDDKPWESVKGDKLKFDKTMEYLFIKLSMVAKMLDPFMPETSEKIKKALETKKLDEVLFARIK
ncbi:MAG: methionine--tRNA ligase [Candidatus Moraniibacteriota bacterium]